jgi:hypothetical protein
VVVLINPKVELGNSRLWVDAFESTKEGIREELLGFVEFVELITDKVIESFSLVDANKVEKCGPNDASIKNIENDVEQIMQYFIPVIIDKKCIKKIHSL